MRTAPRVFVSHCGADAPRGSDWAGSGCLGGLTPAAFSFWTAGRGLWKIRERVRSVQLQKAKQLLLSQAGCQTFRHVKEGKIHQPLDHFNPQDLRTFPQVENESRTCPFNLVETFVTKSAAAAHSLSARSSILFKASRNVISVKLYPSQQSLLRPLLIS